VLAGLLTAAGCATSIAGSAVPAPDRAVAAAACSGGTVIQPKGAPYCYLLPAGFADTTGKLSLQYQGANPSSYVSAVAVAPYDTIIVAVYPLRLNSDSLSESALSDLINGALSDTAAAGIKVVSQSTITSVDGARAVRLTVSKTDGQFTSTLYFAFRGYTEVELDCQWAQAQAVIDGIGASGAGQPTPASMNPDATALIIGDERSIQEWIS